MSSRFRFAATAAALATSILALGACNKNGSAAPPATDTANNSVGVVSAATTLTAEGFVTAAATSVMYEMQAANLAKEKSTNAAVKKFAARMIHDHTASSAKLTQILGGGRVNATLPTDLDERRKGLKNNLVQSAPGNFDKTYVDQQVAAHQEAVTLFKGYADKGENADLKAFATSTLPTIQAHLAMVKDIQAALAK
jgi:putative membrane protein